MNLHLCTLLILHHFVAATGVILCCEDLYKFSNITGPWCRPPDAAPILYESLPLADGYQLTLLALCREASVGSVPIRSWNTRIYINY